MYKLLGILVLVCSIRAGCTASDDEGKCCPIGVNNACYGGDLIDVFRGGHKHLNLSLLVKIFTYCDRREDKCSGLINNILLHCGTNSGAASTCKAWFENKNKAIKQGILNRVPVVAEQMADVCIKNGSNSCLDLAERLVKVCSQMDNDGEYPLASVCPIFFKSTATVAVPICETGKINTNCSCGGTPRTNGYCGKNLYLPPCGFEAGDVCYCVSADKICAAGQICSATCTTATFPDTCTNGEPFTAPCSCGGTYYTSGYCDIGYTAQCTEGASQLADTCYCVGGGSAGVCPKGATCGASSTDSCSETVSSISVCTPNTAITSTCSCGGTLYSSGYCSTVNTVVYYLPACVESSNTLDATCYCHAGTGTGTPGPGICKVGGTCIPGTTAGTSGCNRKQTAYPAKCVNGDVITDACTCGGAFYSEGYCTTTYLELCKIGTSTLPDTCYCTTGSADICASGGKCQRGGCSGSGATMPANCGNGGAITSSCRCAGILRSNGTCIGTGANAKYVPPCEPGPDPLAGTCYCPAGAARVCENGNICSSTTGCNVTTCTGTGSASCVPPACTADGSEITKSCYCGTKLASPDTFCLDGNIHVPRCPVDVTLVEGCQCTEYAAATNYKPCGVGDKCVSVAGCNNNNADLTTPPFVEVSDPTTIVDDVVAYCGGTGVAAACDTFLNNLLSIPNPNQKTLQAIETIAGSPAFVAKIASQQAGRLRTTAIKLLSVCVSTKTPGICAGFFANANANVAKAVTVGNDDTLLKNLLDFVSYFPESRFPGSTPVKNILENVLKLTQINNTIRSSPTQYLAGLLSTCYEDKNFESCSVLNYTYRTTALDEVGRVYRECHERGLDCINETVGIVGVCATQGISNPICEKFSYIFVDSASLEYLETNCGSGPAKADWKTDDFAKNLECRAAQKALLKVCDGNYDAICRSIHEVVWEIEKVIAPLPPSFLVNTYHWFWNLIFE